MVYQGSKNRISKEILKHIEPHLTKEKIYYEPFVGGANMIDKIPKNKVKKLVGNDMNKYLIALLNYVKNNDIPFNYICKEDWYEKYSKPFKKDPKNLEKKYPDWYIGYLGFTKTFSGIFMQSWAGNKDNDGSQRNYQQVAHNNIIKQSINLKGIDFICGDYKDMKIEEESIVYIDPPYKSTFKYFHNLDHNELYNWIRILVKEKKCVVFVSEYDMPDDFKCIWTKGIIDGLGQKPNVEKLFILK